ncbi:hypothetical protein SKAU_G00251590 [Synaphobranchus kaupii]|uniref:Uncharacterized protein n=1 Tax=Synaphobranchus kaupii TaxID=118154 RepID=A0A9Q1IPV0_SYNKA|nr:hypothetical protein SKAU_G00251590 [Synaphobranchus kaupii]
MLMHLGHISLHQGADDGPAAKLKSRSLSSRWRDGNSESRCRCYPFRNKRKEEETLFSLPHSSTGESYASPLLVCFGKERGHDFGLAVALEAMQMCWDASPTDSSAVQCRRMCGEREKGSATQELHIPDPCFCCFLQIVFI